MIVKKDVINLHHKKSFARRKLFPRNFVQTDVKDPWELWVCADKPDFRVQIIECGGFLEVYWLEQEEVD